MTSPRIVLFDLDGTVIDSTTLIRESHRHAVRTVLGRDLDDETLVANVGRPLLEQMRVFSPEHAEELLDVYREWNHARTAELLRSYPGVEELLEALIADGRRLGIVTSKSGPTVQLAFDVLPLRDRFATLVASEDTDRHKPEPDPVLLAVERLGGRPEDAVYVGDAPFDMRAGRAAGVRAIGVTWGFFPAEALREAGAHVVVDSVEGLAAELGL